VCGKGMEVSSGVHGCPTAHEDVTLLCFFISQVITATPRTVWKRMA